MTLVQFSPSCSALLVKEAGYEARSAGWMSERLKVSVLKTEVSSVDTGGSNPSPSEQYVSRTTQKALLLFTKKDCRPKYTYVYILRRTTPFGADQALILFTQPPEEKRRRVRERAASLGLEVLAKKPFFARLFKQLALLLTLFLIKEHFATSLTSQRECLSMFRLPRKAKQSKAKQSSARLELLLIL